jgi:hypothetical protein
MQDSWLYGMSLRKNRSKALPVNSRKAGLDGIDDYININNSGNVGSPYDFEYNQAFTFAIKLTPRANLGAGGCGIFAKDTATAGYYMLIDSSYKLQFCAIQSNGNRISAAGVTGGSGPDATTYAIFRYNGSGDIKNGLWFYLYTPTMVRTVVNGLGFANVGSPVLTTTIRNTKALSIGGFFGGSNSFKGVLEHASVWNTILDDPQTNELAARMANDTVNVHPLYNSNCVGYWREFLAGQVINAKNQTYNGTYSGFTNP